MSRDISHQPRVPRAPSNLALNPAREGAATASLGSLGQGPTTLMVKNFFLISNLNLPSFSLQPFPLVLSLRTLVQSPSPPFLQAPSGTGSCSKLSSQCGSSTLSLRSCFPPPSSLPVGLNRARCLPVLPGFLSCSPNPHFVSKPSAPGPCRCHALPSSLSFCCGFCWVALERRSH